MAVAFDAVGPSSAGAGNNSATSLSWTHTAASSGVALVVGAACGNLGDSAFSLTATCDGVTMTPLTSSIHAGGGSNGFIRLFGLPNIGSGARAIVVTAAGGTPEGLSGGSISASSADTSAAFGTPATATGNSGSASVTVTGTTSGNLIVAVVGDGSASSTGWGATATSRWVKDLDFSTGCSNTEGATKAAGGSVTVTDTINSDTWAIAAVEILAPSSAVSAHPAAAASAGVAPAAATVPAAVMSGPNYAQAAADLGTGLGVWVNPSAAAGGP